MSTNEHDLIDETWDPEPSQFTIDSNLGRFDDPFPDDLAPPNSTDTEEGEEDGDLEDYDDEEGDDLDDVEEPEEDEPDDDGEDEIGINPFTDEDL